MLAPAPGRPWHCYKYIRGRALRRDVIDYLVYRDLSSTTLLREPRTKILQATINFASKIGVRSKSYIIVLVSSNVREFIAVASHEKQAKTAWIVCPCSGSELQQTYMNSNVIVTGARGAHAANYQVTRKIE